MELRNLTNNPTDYLDAYCDAVVGHTNWSFVEPEDIDIPWDIVTGYSKDNISKCIIIYNEPEEEHEDA